MLIEYLQLMVGQWLLHSILAAVLASPLLYFGRHRVTWQPFELLAFVIPFIVWAVLFYAYNKGKSLANIGEWVLISLGIVIAVAIRVAVGHQYDQRAWPACLLFSLIILAVATHRLTPSWPE